MRLVVKKQQNIGTKEQKDLNYNHGKIYETDYSFHVK